MTTFNYDRYQLAKALKIHPFQLPYFGAISACIMCKYKFLEIAELIKQNFSSVEIEKFFKMNIEDFHEHLNYFSGSIPKEVPKPVNGVWDSILCLAEIRHTAGVAKREILTCLLNHKFFTSPKVIHKSISPVAKLLPLRTRIYEILFYEYPGEVFVKDYFFPFNGTMKAEERKISVSKRSHCGLINLWSEDHPKDEKIKLFCKAFSSTLSPEDLNDIDVKEELLFPFLAIFYLLNEVGVEFTEYRLKTLMIQSILANELTAEDMQLYEATGDTEVLELSDWFLTTVEHITLLNSVCGSPFCMNKTSMVNYYSGKILQHVYRKIKDENFDEDMWSPDVCATYKNFLSGMEKLKKA